MNANRANNMASLSSEYHAAASSAAEEAIESLLSVYWGHSFDTGLLEALIEAVIIPILTGAIPLSVQAYDEARDRPLTKPRIYPRPTVHSVDCGRPNDDRISKRSSGNPKRAKKQKGVPCDV